MIMIKMKNQILYLQYCNQKNKLFYLIKNKKRKIKILSLIPIIILTKGDDSIMKLKIVNNFISSNVFKI